MREPPTALRIGETCRRLLSVTSGPGEFHFQLSVGHTVCLVITKPVTKVQMASLPVTASDAAVNVHCQVWGAHHAMVGHSTGGPLGLYAAQQQPVWPVLRLSPPHFVT